jgi:beta-N-acetylhexosaminidase
MKYCLFESPYRDVQQAISQVNTPDQIDRSKSLHEQAMTLIRNEKNLVPLSQASDLNIHVVSISMFQSVMYPDAYWGNLSGTSLAREVKKLYPAATWDVFDVEPPDGYIDALVANAQTASPDVLIIGTYHAYYHSQQQKLVNALLDLEVPTILVALALPYDLMAFPEIPACLATYSNRTIAIETAARALFGLADPQGRLPVRLPGLYDYGWSAN